MKEVLITGKNGYIGKNIGELLKSQEDKYIVSYLSLRKENWEKNDFSKYDIVIHLAGMVHLKENKKNYNVYDEINYELTKKISKLALSGGVKHFVFMSTIAVYGVESLINKSVIINENTPTKPKTYYGKSKLKAENFLKTISNDEFKVTIVRPPMVYGDNCPGNYNSLEKIALRVPIFPKIENNKSVVNINKLSVGILRIIENPREETIVIQDDTYMNTSQTVKNIALSKNKKLYLSKTLGILVCFFGYRSKILNKIFGNMVYK